LRVCFEYEGLLSGYGGDIFGSILSIYRLTAVNIYDIVKILHSIYENCGWVFSKCYQVEVELINEGK